jgi:CheY-like chemotaxis protein
MAGKRSVEECLKLLGLQQEATPDDYRRAYRDLAEVWHPDRFAHKERLQRLADDHLKEINEAYAFLMERWREKPQANNLRLEGARPRILCVDDEPLMLLGLRRRLSRRYEVVTAEGAEAGLDVLLGDEEIAVILSDLLMPRVDGIEFLRQAMSVSPHSTRILLTGHKEAVSMAVALDRTFLFKILDKGSCTELLLSTIEQGVEAWRVQYGATGG